MSLSCIFNVFVLCGSFLIYILQCQEAYYFGLAGLVLKASSGKYINILLRQTKLLVIQYCNAVFTLCSIS